MEDMKVIFVRPGHEAEVKMIGKDLASMQKTVGGNIEAVYFCGDPVAIICNEDGKINNLPLNRALTDSVGQVLDVVAGDFFICGFSGEDFTSLSDEMLDKYLKKFKYPEFFARTENNIVAVQQTFDKYLKKSKYPEFFARAENKIVAVQHESIHSHKNDMDEEFFARLEKMFS